MGVSALALQSALQIGSVAILARLLTPGDFGLVAMALTFVSLLLSIADFGLVMASTQRKQISDDQLSTMFWINLAGGLVLAMLTGGLSVLFARVYNEPRLIGVALVLSCQFIAIGIGAQHEAVIRRDLKYVAFYGISAGSQVVGLSAGVLGALVGIGSWALVGQIVVAQIVRTGLLWWKSGWCPRRIFVMTSVLPMLRFGMKLTPASLLSALSRVMDLTIVGAVFGTHDLGLYQRGSRIVAMPTNYVSKALVSTVPSSLSRLQDDDDGFSRFFINSLAIYCFATFAPIGLICGGSAVNREHVAGTTVVGRGAASEMACTRWIRIYDRCIRRVGTYSHWRGDETTGLADIEAVYSGDRSDHWTKVGHIRHRGRTGYRIVCECKLRSACSGSGRTG